MKEQIIYKAVVGSKLYGTHSALSDTDIKGIFLPDLHDLILGKAPKHYTLTTSSLSDKNTFNDVDETYYSLQYFLELLAKGETNAMDLFFSISNSECVLKNDDIWKENFNEILSNCITKNCRSYLSYCKSQAQKYSIKGDKLKHYKTFKELLETELLLNWYSDTSTLKEFLDKKLEISDVPTILTDDIPYEFINNYIPKPGEERVKFTKFNFGDHCYIETAQNKESYLTISDVKFQLNDSIKSAYYKVQKVIASYGKRAEAAANDLGVDWKAISHCVRVLLQVEELLTTNKITFPLINADFVKSIKYNTSSMSYEEIMKWIENHIMHIDEVLLPKSTLREKADYKWIEEFILKQYKYEKGE